MPICKFRSGRTTMCFAAVVMVSAAAPSAYAGSTSLGDSGWRVRWDSSLNGLVDVDFIEQVGNTVFLQKAAEFNAPAVNGVHTPIVITFEQIGASTVTNFVIDDEIINNSTGSTWTGFMMKVNNNPDVHFDPAATLASGGSGPIGYSINPFTTAEFLKDDRRLDISGGLVTPNSTWYPGGGANDGQLWISMNSGAEGNFQTFNLTEKPLSTVIPGPSALLAMLGLPLMNRRRRR